jgi:glycosyltransferase involved in cell wall biosynthesis
MRSGRGTLERQGQSRMPTLRRREKRKILRRAAVSCLLQLPSGKLTPWEGGAHRVRLLAVTRVRNEGRFLPGMLRNVGRQVDGIIALDDGSTDGSDCWLEESAQVIELLRNPPGSSGSDEAGSHRRLVEAALRHGAEWVVAVDADERLEREFRLRAERVIRRGRWLGLEAFEIHCRELWNSPDLYRADGIWGRKWSPRLFRALPDHRFDQRPFHAAKAPLQGKIFGIFPLADLIIYHLRMVRPQDREARRRRYERLDAEARCQPGLGYAYLTDERGIKLRPVPARRNFEE